ncbi:MAG TPA: hypothetical protein VG847_17320 [Chitinophagaceae bacterium]|nr:hypothetical protein [Chitinophagaceae bacterium]
MPGILSVAQKQTFDVVSFAIPKGWQQQQNDVGIQLSVTDEKTAGYAIAVITKANPSTASAGENFSDSWNKVVKASVQINTEPVMQDPVKENGWDIISGSANYTDGANRGTVTLITASGGGQTASVVLITNTKQYENDLLAFLHSLDLSKASQNGAGNSAPAITGAARRSSVVGLWVDYNLETLGTSFNGMPQYTAGYRRKEYAFYADGTYLFRNKQWVTLQKEILYIYERGTYTVNGNQLIITPQKGRGGWWSKAASNKNNEWGSLVKASGYKPESVTYSFTIAYFSGNQIYELILKPRKPTERDGGNLNNPNDPYEFHYSLRDKNNSLIDDPPGFSTGFENKPTSAGNSSATKSVTSAILPAGIK